MAKKRKSTKKFSANLRIETDEQRKKAAGYILEHLEDLNKSGTKVASLVAEPFGKPKSFEQLELFHSVILDSFFFSCNGSHSRAWWKFALKEKFLARPMLDESSRPMFRKDGSAIMEVPSLSKLKRAEMSQFIDNVLEEHFHLFYTEIILSLGSQCDCPCTCM